MLANDTGDRSLLGAGAPSAARSKPRARLCAASTRPPSTASSVPLAATTTGSKRRASPTSSSPRRDPGGGRHADRRRAGALAAARDRRRRALRGPLPAHSSRRAAHHGRDRTKSPPTRLASASSPTPPGPRPSPAPASRCCPRRSARASLPSCSPARSPRWRGTMPPRPPARRSLLPSSRTREGRLAELRALRAEAMPAPVAADRAPISGSSRALPRAAIRAKLGACSRPSAPAACAAPPPSAPWCARRASTLRT